jgi:protoporphyrin/coproporphyrin ferrochelatase
MFITVTHMDTLPNRVNLPRPYAVKSYSIGNHTVFSLGQYYHKKSSACKCDLGWSSLHSRDVKHHFRGYSSASEAVLTSQSDLRKLLVGNEKIGVLLLNLGGPETLDDVQPFLFNLFADPVITMLQANELSIFLLAILFRLSISSPLQI